MAAQRGSVTVLRSHSWNVCLMLQFTRGTLPWGTTQPLGSGALCVVGGDREPPPRWRGSGEAVQTLSLLPWRGAWGPFSGEMGTRTGKSLGRGWCSADAHVCLSSFFQVLQTICKGGLGEWSGLFSPWDLLSLGGRSEMTGGVGQSGKEAGAALPPADQTHTDRERPHLGSCLSSGGTNGVPCAQ